MLELDSDDAIVEVLSSASQTPAEASLLQETFASIGTLHRTKPHLFEGLRSIHLHSLLKLCAAEDQALWSVETALSVGHKSPSELLECINNILESQQNFYRKGLTESFSVSHDKDLKSVSENAVDTDWFGWRITRGLIVNFDRNFLEAIWQSLSHATHLIFGDSASSECVIDCEVVRSSMTPREEIFAQLIDNSIQKLHPHYYKCAIIESIVAFTTFCSENPTAKFEKLNLSEILEKAADDFCDSKQLDTSSNRAIDLLLREPTSTLQAHFIRALERENTEITTSA